MKNIPKDRHWALYGIACSLWSILYFFASILYSVSGQAAKYENTFAGMLHWYLLFAAASLFFFAADVFRRKRAERAKKALILDAFLTVLTFGGAPILICFGGSISPSAVLWVAYHLLLCSLMISDVVCDTRRRVPTSDDKPKEKFSWKSLFLRLLEVLLLSHKFQIQTKLSEDEIYKRVERFVIKNEYDYDGWLKDHGFLIKRHPFHHNGGRNDFAPAAYAKISASESITTVSILLRIRFLPALFLPIYFVILCHPVLAPATLIVLWFSLFLPARKLKMELVQMLTEEVWLLA